MFKRFLFTGLVLLTIGVFITPATAEVMEREITKIETMKGRDHLFGKNGATQDWEQAVYWLKSAADKGSVSAWYLLGSAYAMSGEHQDLDQAEKWMAKAVDAEYIGAYYDYAFLLYQRDQVKNAALIEEWANKAIAAGDGRGKGLLLKLNGESDVLRQVRQTLDMKVSEAAAIKAEQANITIQEPPPSFDEVVKADLDFDANFKAAKAGNAEGQFKTGYAYYTGHGIRKNYKDAADWLDKAAAQGESKALYQLGRMHLEDTYFYNMGAGQSDAESRAFTHFQKAAKNGFAPAQYQLSLAYQTGRGIAKDADKAGLWRDKAIAQGFVPPVTEKRKPDTAAHSASRIHTPKETRRKKNFDENCALLIKPDIEMIFQPEPVEYDYSVSSAALTFKAKGDSAHAKYGEVQGLHDPTVKYKFRFGFLRQLHADGQNHCLNLSNITLYVEYQSKIFIANDLDPDSCEFENVKDHELRHRQVDEQTYKEYGRILEGYIAEIFYQMPPLPPIEYKDLMSEKVLFKKVIREKTKEGIKAMEEELRRRQIFIDTPEEYLKASQNCD